MLGDPSAQHGLMQRQGNGKCRTHDGANASFAKAVMEHRGSALAKQPWKLGSLQHLSVPALIMRDSLPHLAPSHSSVGSGWTPGPLITE